MLLGLAADNHNIYNVILVLLEDNIMVQVITLTATEVYKIVPIV